MNDKTEIAVSENKTILSLSDMKDLLDIIYVVNALLRNGGNVTHAAEELEIGRRTIYI